MILYNNCPQFNSNHQACLKYISMLIFLCIILIFASALISQLLAQHSYNNLQLRLQMQTYSVKTINPISVSHQSIVLQNPFHPLDLSAHDLLTIYKKFEQSCSINHNAKHELPIEVITQLICTLKACKPSYIQKCITQSLIKPTISWSDFLMFLDKQSEVRQQILLWLMQQKSLVKYHLSQRYPQYPIRSKIQKRYQYINYLRTIDSNYQQKLMLVMLDNRSILLVQISTLNNTLQLQELDRYVKKNDNIIADFLKKQEQVDQSTTNDNIQNPSMLKKPRKRKISTTYYSNTKKVKNLQLHYNNQSQLSLIQGQQTSQQNNNSFMVNSQVNQDDQSYFKRDRKNIESLFNLFCQLPIEESVQVAKIGVNRISQRTLNPSLINNLKQEYINLTGQQSQNTSHQIFATSLRPLQKAKNHLQLLYKQKKVLSYNPHKRIYDHFSVSKQPAPIKKINYERKQKQYFLESMEQTYSQQLSCMAVVYYNMDLVIIKVVKEYNKILLEQQTVVNLQKKTDKNSLIKNVSKCDSNVNKVQNHNKSIISTRTHKVNNNSQKVSYNKRDNKKNQIVESVQFYYHSIVGRWFVLVLFRNQQGRKQSCLRGYQLIAIQNKRRFDNNYKFLNNRETFNLLLDKKQMIVMRVQPKYGIHMISQDGKYTCFREEYTQSENQENVYWKFQWQQKFKGQSLSLCCLAVGTSINKLLFGTIKGIIIIYDTFSRNFQTRRVSSCQIIQVQIQSSQGYILTSDEKLHIYQMSRGDKIQTLNVRNENKLHEKVTNINLDRQQLCCYGTEAKVYQQHVDHNLLHENRQMQNMYTWRLKKIGKNNSIMPAQLQQIRKEKNKSILQNKQLKIVQNEQNKHQQLKHFLTEQIQRLNEHRIGQNTGNNKIQMMITSESYFILLSQILQVLLVCRIKLRIKFTIILSIPYDSRVMKISLSKDQKLLIILLLDQHIYIFNIHTQDLYLHLEPHYPHKFTNTTFLDRKNQYLLATGTENGKVLLIPYPSVADKKFKVLNLHNKNVSVMTVKKQIFVTAGEDGKIGVWQLPFNILKYELQCSNCNDFAVEEIGFFRNQYCILKTISGNLLQINTKKGSLGIPNNLLINCFTQASDEIEGKLIGVSKNSSSFVKNQQSYNLHILFRNDQEYKQCRQIIHFNSKYGEVIAIGIAPSEKAIIFYTSGMISTWHYQDQRMGKISQLKI